MGSPLTTERLMTLTRRKSAREELFSQLIGLPPIESNNWRRLRGNLRVLLEAWG
jgi:hypothetical protein